MTQYVVNKVLTRYLEASRSVEAFCVVSFAKFHPVYNVAVKARKAADKAMAQARRYMAIASKAGGYKGDPARVQPNLDKAYEAVVVLVKAAQSLHEPMQEFLKEYDRDLESDYRKRVHADLVKWLHEMNGSLWGVIANDKYKGKFQGDYYEFSWFVQQDISDLYKGLANVTSSVEMAAKIPLKGPGAVDSNAPPEARFRAHMTSDIITMAKTAAKKLGNKPALCAALGGDVLEDVNAHSELRLIMPLIKHYYDALTDEERTAVRSLVSKVATALDWGIVEAGAFCAAIMKVSGAPETERVIDTLAKAFDEFTKD